MLINNIYRLRNSTSLRYLFSNKKSQEQLAYNQQRLKTLQQFSISFWLSLSCPQTYRICYPFSPKIPSNQITTKAAIDSRWSHHFCKKTWQDYIHWCSIIAHTIANCSSGIERLAWISQRRCYWSYWSGFCDKKRRALSVGSKKRRHLGGQSLPLDVARVQLTQR